MKKKTISLLLGSALIASMLFTGCGNQENSIANAETQTASSSETNIESASTESVEKLEKVSVTITAVRGDDSGKWEDMTLVQQLEDNASDYLEIEWLDWAASSKLEKTNLAMASGQYTDAMIGTWFFNGATTAKYAGEGILVPLEDYITEELTPNLYKIFEMRPEYKEALTAPDGHIYGLPHYDEPSKLARTVNETIVINTEWLEAVGKEMPTTTEELYEVLAAFRDAGDLNGNGVKDEIPMSFYYADIAFGAHIKGIHSLLGWFGVPGNQNGITQLDNGEVVFTGTQPEFKEAVQYLHRLYSENLLDKEIFTQSSSAYDAKIKAPEPTVGVYCVWSTANADQLYGEGVYEYMPVLSSPNGKEPKWAYRAAPITDSMAFFVTDKGADKLPQLMKWVDQFYDFKLAPQLRYGLEGKYIEEVSDYVYRTILDENGKEYTDDVKTADVPCGYSPTLILNDYYKKETQSVGDIQNAEVQEFYKDYLEPPFYYFNVWMTAEEADEASVLFADIGEHYRTHLARWVVEGGIEEEWDAYLAGYEKYNLDKYMDIKVLPEYRK